MCSYRNPSSSLCFTVILHVHYRSAYSFTCRHPRQTFHGFFMSHTENSTESFVFTLSYTSHVKALS